MNGRCKIVSGLHIVNVVVMTLEPKIFFSNYLTFTTLGFGAKTLDSSVEEILPHQMALAFQGSKWKMKIVSRLHIVNVVFMILEQIFF